MNPRTNTVVLSDGIRYAEIISKRFLCPKCRIFCVELTPVYSRGMLRRLKLQGQPMPTVKVMCKNGCHFHEGWGWEVFSWDSITQRNRVKEWPEDWKTGRDTERKVRR